MTASAIESERGAVETYGVFRRNGWRTTDDLQDAAGRSAAEGESMGEEVRWLRSYVIAERDGTVGTICIYQATSPEAIRRHADRADLPIDEIVQIADTLIVQSDPIQITT